MWYNFYFASFHLYQLTMSALAIVHTGSLEQFQQFVTEWNWIREDIVRNNNRLLREACEYGRLDIVLWLLDNYLQAEDLKDFNNGPMGEAATHGHLDVVQALQWRAIEWGVPFVKEDFKSFNMTGGCSVFIAVCNEGHAHILDWMYEQGFLTQDDYFPDHVTSYVIAATQGHLDVLRWLDGHFPVSSEDMIKAFLEYDINMKDLSSFGFEKEIVTYLRNTFVKHLYTSIMEDLANIKMDLQKEQDTLNERVAHVNEMESKMSKYTFQ